MCAQMCAFVRKYRYLYRSPSFGPPHLLAMDGATLAMDSKAERRKKNTERMSLKRKQDQDLAKLPPPNQPVWQGAIGLAMPLPSIQSQMVQTEPFSAPRIEVSPQLCAGRFPMCPVECAGLKELIATFHEKPNSSILKLLLTFQRDKPTKMKMIREGPNSQKTCEIDISTNVELSEALAIELGKDLLQLLQVSQQDIDLCKQCADVLGVNTHGTFGVYCYHNITEVHGHMLGVLNLLLSGTKVWYLWPPGPRPTQYTPASLIITQQAGQLLWLPPGWYHKVDTTGVGVGIKKDRLPFSLRNISEGKEIRVAHGFTTWCLPAQVRDYALLSYASGASEESQMSINTGTRKADKITALYKLLVQHV